MMDRRTHDLTARAAGRREATGDHSGGDLLVIDDQTLGMQSFNDEVAGGTHRVVAVPGVRELEHALEHGWRDGSPVDPVLALVDLDLGDERESGLEAVRLLARHAVTAQVPVVLNTNVPGSPHRKLLACLCAEVLGPGVLLATKSNEDVHRLRDLLTLATATKQAGGRVAVEGPMCGLGFVRPVLVRSTQGGRVLRPLSDVLAGRRWKEEFWAQLVRTRDLAAAHAQVTDDRAPTHAGGIDDLKSSPKEMARHDLGHLPTALIEAGGDLFDLPGGILDLGLSTALDGRPPRAARLESFAATYARALTNPDLYVEAAP